MDKIFTAACATERSYFHYVTVTYETLETARRNNRRPRATTGVKGAWETPRSSSSWSAAVKAAKENALWGTFGKGGVEHCHGTCPKHQLRWKRLVDCSTPHLKAILRSQRQAWQSTYVDIIEGILKDRGVKPAGLSPKAERELFAAADKAKPVGVKREGKLPS